MIDDFKYVFGGRDYEISDALIVRNPLVEEILDYGEKEYWRTLNVFTGRTYDAMVPLWDLGIDYQTISDFSLFISVSKGLTKEQSAIFFGDSDLDLSNCSLMHDENENICIFSGLDSNGNRTESDIVIDEIVYSEIAGYLRKIHFIEPTPEYDPGNSFAKKRLIQKMRRKAEKDQKEGFTSVLSNMGSLIINSGQTSYTYDSIQKIKISQLFDSFNRINKVDSYKNVMAGIYHGTVDSAKIDTSELHWANNIIK